MKANIKKQLRLQVVIGMVVISLILLASDVTAVYGYVTKCAAVLLGCGGFCLFKRWKAADLLPRLEEI